MSPSGVCSTTASELCVPASLNDSGPGRLDSIVFASATSMSRYSKRVDYSCNNIGTVMNQSPPAGSAVVLGSAVTVTIGARPRRPCT
jgi:hypothetical protein